MKPPDVEIEIDALVLHGFPPSAHRRVGAALRAELRRLVRASSALPAAAESRARVDGGRLQVPAGAHPRVVGREVARAVFRGVWG